MDEGLEPRYSGLQSASSQLSARSSIRENSSDVSNRYCSTNSGFHLSWIIWALHVYIPRSAIYMFLLKSISLMGCPMDSDMIKALSRSLMRSLPQGGSVLSQTVKA